MSNEILPASIVLYVINAMQDRFLLGLTADHVKIYARQDGALHRSLLAGHFTGSDERVLIDIIVRDVLGSGWKWPDFDRGKDAEKFMDQWLSKAPKAGLKVYR